ncbi:MAG: hypothetical protein ABIP94_25860, partial [Planctomycetota bacterium]
MTRIPLAQSLLRSVLLSGLCAFAIATGTEHAKAQIEQITSGVQHAPGRRIMVRFDDTLYAVGIATGGSLDLWRRPEGAAAWSPVPIAGGINDPNSGIGASSPTNSVAMAV